MNYSWTNVTSLKICTFSVFWGRLQVKMLTMISNSELYLQQLSNSSKPHENHYLCCLYMTLVQNMVKDTWHLVYLFISLTQFSVTSKQCWTQNSISITLFPYKILSQLKGETHLFCKFSWLSFTVSRWSAMDRARSLSMYLESMRCLRSWSWCSLCSLSMSILGSNISAFYYTKLTRQM